MVPSIVIYCTQKLYSTHSSFYHSGPYSSPYSSQAIRDTHTSNGMLWACKY